MKSDGFKTGGRGAGVYDLVVIGNGAAAFAAAIAADEAGASTAVVQGGVIGGTCVNVGCVPSKRMLSAGEVIRYTLTHDLGQGAVNHHHEKFSFEKIVEAKDSLVKGLRLSKYSNVMSNLSHVTVYRGMGEFVSPDTVRVKTKQGEAAMLKARKFIVATGSSPKIPRFKGVESTHYWTNVEALSPKRRPASLIVIGGRALALEFAQMYVRLGVRVTLLQRSPSILPEHEPEVSEALTRYLGEEGVKIVTGVAVDSVSRRGGGGTAEVEATVGGRRRVYRAQALLLATGRAPNTEGLNLEAAGVKTGEDGSILVDDEMRTSSPNIYAAGDVTGEPMLEALAAREGTLAAVNALAGAHGKIDVNLVPKVVFTDPNVASVGLTEQQAIAKGHRCSCAVVEFAEVARALISGDARGMIKMVADAQTHKVLGVHIVSPHAAEFITEASVMLKAGYTIEDVVDTVHVFPTLAESIKIVAQSFFRDPELTSCCI